MRAKHILKCQDFWGQKSLGPLKKPREIADADYVFCQLTKITQLLESVVHWYFYVSMRQYNML